MQKLKPILAALVALSTLPIIASAQGTPQPNLSGNDPHWFKISDQNCWTYDPAPSPGETATWRGSCINQLTSGQGILIWHEPDGSTSTTTGTMDNGAFEGVATFDHTLKNGSRRHEVSNVVHGVQNGYATVELYDENGLIVERYQGTVKHAVYNGQGHRTLFRPDGSISWEYAGLFVNGKPDSSHVQTAPTAPSYSSGASAQTEISDASMLADIAEINKVDPSFLKGRDPRLPSIENSIGDLFYGRSALTPGHWGSDKSSQDFVEANRWYKEAQTRLLAFNPALSAPQTAGCVSPRSPPAYTSPGAESFYRGSSNCQGYDDFVHAWQMGNRAAFQLTSNGIALREQAKQEDEKAKAATENLSRNVPKCDDQRMFAQIYKTIADSPSGIAGGLRMRGISDIEEASDQNSSTTRVCYAEGNFNDGKKFIKYSFEFVSNGKFEITVTQPGALESILFLGKHMKK